MSTKNYKNTLNLPKTDFPMKADLPIREPDILNKWQDEKLYAAIHRKSAGRSKFILHDGPPYANGHIHMGHVLNKVLKDIVVKFETMRGKDAHYVPGWDCHGLPIEHQCLKDMGKRKEQVERVSFRKEARKYAEKFVDIQRDEFKRLGVFGDWENPYLTMNFSYQAAIAESFLKLFEIGYIEQRLKPVPWCFDCETALADAELEYEDKTDKAVYVKFPMGHNPLGPEWIKDFSYLVWTTTPWTIPANVGIAVHPDLGYVCVETEKGKFIFAEALLDIVLKKLGIIRHRVIKRLKGVDFQQNHNAVQPFINEITYPLANSKLILAGYVSSTDGTGIVHIAPGHGEEDYQYGHLKNHLPIVSPVDEKGRFTDEFPPCKGENVFKANSKIIELLKQKGALLHEEEYKHSYPHCWRCKKPIIFRATPQWFLKIEERSLRKKILDEIQNKITFIPDWGKNRIGSMVETRPDWCLSRQRYWGVPIPVIRCATCANFFYVKESHEKIVSIFEKEGADAWFARPAEDFLPPGFKCKKCGGREFKKEEDIIDVWFDSGVSHQAVLKKNKELGKLPCAMYLEGSDQHRGWFQSSLITAVALDGQSPFERVLTHGFIVDGDGKKMSKSSGNVTSPEKMMAVYGADILRLWVASCDYSQDIRLSEEILKHTAQAYVKFRNTFRHLLANLYDFDHEKHSVPFEQMEAVDRWIIAKCTQLLKEVEQTYENFRFHEVYKAAYQFVVVALSSFYFDVLKDRLYTAGKDSRIRRSGQTAFHYILIFLSKILAPLIPFTADEVWRCRAKVSEADSVHLADWPVFEDKFMDETLLGEWEDLWMVREEVMKALEEEREAGKIRAPLEAMVEIRTGDKLLCDLLKRYETQLRFYWIVSQVSIAEDPRAKEKGQKILLPHAEKQVFLDLSVHPAKGKKCERCWNFSEAVGTFPEHPQLCDRCVEVVATEAVS
ncbi:MAG: isoleucine--tRNA ligase [Candidatus Omnitrophica bacterium]|nr:isoleucine--tRNA ligase [Candidatus Omnitrophota bacterium]